MYLWRPNDSEIENYRISTDIALLNIYIKKLYKYVIFRDYYGMTIVIDSNNNELGFISNIEELK